MMNSAGYLDISRRLDTLRRQDGETRMVRKILCLRLLVAALLLAAGSVGARADWPAQWRPPIYPVPGNVVQAATVGLKPDPVNSSSQTDVTQAFEKALASIKPGQTLYLAPGVYNVRQALLIPSGAALQGPQDGQGHPLATIHQTGNVGMWQPGKLFLGVLVNADYAASTITDGNITLTAIAVDHGSALFRMARNVRVQGCSFDAGGDGVAFLASENTVVSATLVTNTINAAFDYWDGDSNATIENSVAFISDRYGISFNSADTDGSGRISRDLRAINNVISGAGNDGAGIYVDPLGRGGSKMLGTITITGNTIGPPRKNARAGGIIVSSGDATVVTIEGNHIVGSYLYPPIFVHGYRQDEGYTTAGQPGKVLILNNTLENNVVASAHGALVRIEGRIVDAAHNVVRKNGEDDGHPVPFIRSTGDVHAWDNQLTEVAPGPKAYNVPSANLSLQPRPANQN
jgi:hypothetical protein